MLRLGLKAVELLQQIQEIKKKRFLVLVWQVFLMKKQKYYEGNEISRKFKLFTARNVWSIQRKSKKKRKAVSNIRISFVTKHFYLVKVLFAQVNSRRTFSMPPHSFTNFEIQPVLQMSKDLMEYIQEKRIKNKGLGWCKKSWWVSYCRNSLESVLC